MRNESMLSHPCETILPPDAVVELLDNLYDLLPAAQETPLLKVQILDLIRWVEAHIPPAAEEEIHELAIGSEQEADFALLIRQAQLQTQQ